MCKKKRTYGVNVKCWYALAVGGGLAFALLVIGIVAAWVHMLDETNVMKREEEEIMMESESETEAQDSESELQDSVPNFGMWISNLDEFAVPILEDRAYLLEDALLDFFPEMEQTGRKAEIFYVLVPEERTDCVRFYCRIPVDERIVELEFCWTAGEVTASWSRYTETEIVLEIWDGEQPECRDEPE